ncbi:PACE efflux transporter [Enterobacter cancerogenus]|uniref:PACE efflux transporter n=1 Tax=Enterobacter cancerogenus TaxID=69218 RepID=UPI0030766DF8
MKAELNKSRTERICQAVLFEILANGIIICGVTRLTDVTLEHSAALSLISAVTAMVWNYIFNMIFDGIQQRLQIERTFRVSVCGAVLFETGLIIMLVPVVMLLLSMSLNRAIMVETGLIAFFLPYTLAFHQGYDYLRRAVRKRWKRQPVSGSASRHL